MVVSEGKMVIPEVKTQYVFDVKIPQEPHYRLGGTPYGVRSVTAPRSGGRVEGPRLQGKVLMGGGDPYLVRADKIGEKNSRVTIQAENGDLIMMNYRGLWRAPQEVHDAISRGEKYDPAKCYCYVAVLFETSSEEHRWLNESLFIGRWFVPDDFPPPCTGYRIYAIL